MTDILLAIDPNHEESWKKALPEAVDEAKRRGAKIHVLAIVPNLGMSMLASYFPEGFETETVEKAREALLEFCRSNMPEGADWEAHVGHGDIDDEILRFAEHFGVSLIVIGSHEPNQVRTFLIGSHADRVVHRSPVSVLVVRG